jgi:L-threonylcarbamoyladenylate synthase
VTTELYKLRSPSATADEDKSAMERAGTIIRRGGLVAFPTETVYGLGANALDGEAVLRVFAAKNRPADNPLIVHITRPDEAEPLAHTTPLYYKLAEAFMPGPLTVIQQKREIVPDEVTAGLDSVAIRCPSNPAARAFIAAARTPVAAPSANSSGKPSPTSAKYVAADMDGKIDMIIDGGESAFGVESTVVKITGDDSVLLLRPGAVTPEMLREVCARVDIAPAVLGQIPEGERVPSPGMKYKHYAPSTPLTLVDGSYDSVRAFFARMLAEGGGVICDDATADALGGGKIVRLGPKGDEAAHMHRIFAALREADALNAAALYARLPSAQGYELALRNRMLRAAGFNVIKIQ